MLKYGILQSLLNEFLFFQQPLLNFIKFVAVCRQKCICRSIHVAILVIRHCFLNLLMDIIDNII